MEKIDRLGWAGGRSIYAHGYRFGVRTNRPEVLEQIEQRLPPGWEDGISPFVDHLYSLKVGGAKAGSRVREYTLLYAGLTKLIRTMNLTEALDTLEQDLLATVAGWARNYVTLRAGVVGWQGQAILVVGGKGSGKSTLIAALVRAGARYYSDACAMLDARGLVHPYPHRLFLPTAEGERPRPYSITELGGQAGDCPLPVGLVATLRYRAGAGWKPRVLSPGKAILQLIHHAPLAQQEAETVLRLLGISVSDALHLAGVRGDAEETARALLETLENARPAQAA